MAGTVFLLGFLFAVALIVVALAIVVLLRFGQESDQTDRFAAPGPPLPYEEVIAELNRESDTFLRDLAERLDNQQ